VAQEGEYLPTKHKDLSSSPATTKKKEEEKKLSPQADLAQVHTLLVEWCGTMHVGCFDIKGVIVAPFATDRRDSVFAQPKALRKVKKVLCLDSTVPHPHIYYLYLELRLFGLKGVICVLENFALRIY
jgi:hypothetical protein